MLSNEINLLRTRIEMFEDKRSGQIVEKKITRAILNACSKDKASRGESEEIIDCCDYSIPIAPLIVLRGQFNCIPGKIQMDDGCNTNFVLKEFINKHNFVSKEFINKHEFCFMSLKMIVIQLKKLPKLF
jgi:hypothetical protein